MSMKIRRTDLVALAREIYEGNDFEGTLARSKRSFVKKLETKETYFCDLGLRT